VAVLAVILIAVIDPGDRADAILGCLKDKVGELDPVGPREYETSVMGTDVTVEQAIERVTKALGDCDDDWHRYIAVSAPPNPG
jgi:hypothetical protein